MSFDERYDWYGERHETPEFLERVKDYREEVKRLKQIEGDNSLEPDEETRNARQNLSGDQERLAAELDAIIQRIGEGLKHGAEANIPLLPANSAELTEWYKTATPPLTELIFLRGHLHELRTVGIHVPSFSEARRKLWDARSKADDLGLIDRNVTSREDRLLEYNRIYSIMKALGVTVYPGSSVVDQLQKASMIE